jgi:DNA-binding GntR family transcriptional regulator
LPTATTPNIRMESGPRYRALAKEIELAIAESRLEQGLILLESPLSEVLQVSRATVRNALNLLAKKGKVKKFDGRGFRVGRLGDTTRRQITTSDFPKANENSAGGSSASDGIIKDVAKSLSLAIAFGHFRINESILAEQYRVSRPVAREVLWRLHETGLVEKELHSAWQFGPLKAKDVRDEFELRKLIEPFALVETARSTEPLVNSEMLMRIDAAQSAKGRVAPDLVEAIEVDLHEICESHCGNQRIASLLFGGKTPSRISAIFARFVGVEADHPMFAEHRSIMTRLLQFDLEEVSELLVRHLTNEAERALAQLRVLSVITTPELPLYLEKVV